jgi:hypothetical protein
MRGIWWLTTVTLALALGVANAGPTLSAPTAMGHAVAQPDPYPQSAPVVARSPSGAFVMWTTHRDNPNTKLLRGSRIDIDGAVLDPHGLDIGLIYEKPMVLWDGARYVLLWLRGTNQLSVRSLNTSGEMSQETGNWMSPGGTIRSYSAACDGAGGCLIAWWRYDVSAGHYVELGWVKDGVLTRSGVALSSVAADQHEPSVSFDGTRYLVVWRDIRRPDAGDIYAARVSIDAVVQDTEGIAVSLSAEAEGVPQIVWNGSSHLLTWVRDVASGKEIRSVRLDAAASRLTVDDVVLTGVPAEFRLFWNGVEHLAAWHDATGLHALPIDSAGELKPIRTLSTRVQLHPSAISFDGANFWAAWSETRFRETDLYLARVDASGASTPPEGTMVSGVPSREQEPAAASDGNGWLAVWTDYRLGPENIYASRISAAGVALDGEGFLVSRLPLGDLSRSPQVAWSGQSYLVVWERKPKDSIYLEIAAARVSADGQLLDPQPFVVTQAGKTPDVVWNGTDFFVVWSKGLSIEGARVSPSGQLRDSTPILLSRTTNQFQEWPSVAWSGKVHLVTWLKSGDQPLAARVGLDGALLDCGELAFPNNLGAPSVAGGSAGFLAAFTSTAFTSTRGISAMRFDADGKRVDTAPIPLVADELAAAPRVTWDGAGYVLSWWRQTLQYKSSVHVSRVTVKGTLVDGALPPLAESPNLDSGSVREALPVASGEGRALVLYVHAARSTYVNPRYLVAHVWARAWSTSQVGASCGVATDCSSGACEGGICAALAPPVASDPLGFGCAPVDAGTPPVPPDPPPDEEPQTPPEDCSGGCQTTPGTVALLSLLVLLRKVGSR